MKPPQVSVVLARSKNTDKRLDAYVVKVDGHPVSRYPFGRNAATQRMSAQNYSRALADNLRRGLEAWWAASAGTLARAELTARLLPAVVLERATLAAANPAEAKSRALVPAWLDASTLAQECLDGLAELARFERREPEPAIEGDDPPPDQAPRAAS